MNADTILAVIKGLAFAVPTLISVAAVYTANVKPPEPGTKRAAIFAVINYLGQNYGHAANKE